MARFIGKTLLRHATASHSLKGGSAAACVAVAHHRYRSSQATKSRPQSKREKEGEEYEVALKLLDDHIQRIMVKKATPDWLPFLPGSSFWVPPAPSASNVASFIHNFTNQLTHQQLRQQQLQKQPLSVVSTLRGWPSSQHFFIQENVSPHGGDTGVELNSPEGMDMTVQVKVLAFPENITLSEDEEG